MKKGLEMLLRLFYVCMGSFGLWRSIDETFTIPYSRELHPERAVCLLLLLAAAVFCGVICCRRAWLTLLVLGAGIALPFIMGEEPSDGTFLVLVLVMVGDVCSKTGVPAEMYPIRRG